MTKPSIRSLTGAISPYRIQDLETRRCIENILQRFQWVIDNWPDTVKPLSFRFSVANYQGEVQLVGDEVPQKVRRFYGHDSAGRLGFFTLPDDPLFRMSVVNNSGVVTLVNDEQDPDYGQRYGVDVSGEKGWIYPIDHPFRFQQTDDNGGDITAGLVRLNGVNLTVTGLPASLSTLTASMRYWIALDTANGTAEWLSGTVEAYPTFPVGSDSIMIFPILTITCAGATDEEVITGFKQERWVDIVEGSTSITIDKIPTPTPPTYQRTIDDTTNADMALKWKAGDVNGLGQELGLVHITHTTPLYDEYAHTWYSYVRTETFNAKGMLVELSIGDRVTVHEPINHALLPAP